MATSARSTAWHAVDLGYGSVARRILTRSTRAGWRRLLLYPAVLSMGAGLLSACVGERLQPPPQSAAVRLAPPLSAELSPPPHPVRRPAHKPNPPPATDSASSATSGQSLAMAAPNPSETAPDRESSSNPPEPGAVSPAPAPSGSPPPQASELIGLDQNGATRLFGTATERSEEPPATVWRYKNANCELDLFFYLDLRSGRMRTLHYAVKGDGGDKVRRQDCLRSLVAARGN
jgi:hypothetical protein